MPCEMRLADLHEPCASTRLISAFSTCSPRFTLPWHQVNASYPEQPNQEPFRRGSNWVSTGVYAPPGAVITVTLPPSVTLTTTQQLAAQIGVHKDDIRNKASWCRQPYGMVKAVYFDSTTGRTIKIASNQGGPVIIVVLRLVTLGPINVTVSGGVRMPFYYRGTHNNAQWQSTIRNSPAPFAEFASNNFVLTVPSTAVRQISNAQAIVDLYANFLEGYAQLAVVRSFTTPEALF